MSFPATYNFSYYRGDRNEFVVRPKNSDGSAFSLTGYSADFTIATVRGSTGTQYEAQAVVSATSNIVTCTILPGVGINLAPATYVYDVQVTNGASLRYTLLTGSITVTEQVSGAI